MPDDVALAWLWILVGVLISTIGIALAFRRERPAAGFVYAGGLLLLAASVFKVHPALVRYSLSPEVQQLQNELSGAKRELADVLPRLAAAGTRLKQFEDSAAATASDLSANKAAIAACFADKDKEVNNNKRLQSTIDKDALQLDSLRSKLTSLSAGNQTLTAKLDTAKAELQAAAAANRAQKELLTANIDHVRLLEGEKTALSDQLSSKERELEAALNRIAQFKEQIADIKAPGPATQNIATQALASPPLPAQAIGTETSSARRPSPGAKVRFAFESSGALGVDKLENSELVQGEAGDYYLISLKDAKTGAPITFPPAQFVITDKASELHGAMEELRQAVLQRIPARWQYKLFVRGQADGGSFKEPLGDERYRSLEYLPLSDGSGFHYGPKLVRKRLNKEFENEDLPNLRGAFLARALVETVGGDAPVLLGNIPQPGTNIANRRAEIILLLKGPSG